ncbi:MFS general substrate transporter [Aspergillus pseudoustus]|uniref:MFS general substrate transporter n=1 Tax=Aspergillus pseudoustus TaxID=1810923 RepID=A0ABR4JLI4_9EURO
MSFLEEKDVPTVDTYDENPSVRSHQAHSEISFIGSVKQSSKTVIWCFALTSGILLYGYDLVIVGNVSSMPEFQKDFGRRLNGQLIIPSLWLGLWNVANPIGGILGAILGGFIQDHAGRRRALSVAFIVSTIGVAVAYISNMPTDITGRRAVFFVAKLVQGFAVNMAMCTTQTYMSEILPAVLRGPIFALFPIFTLLGQLLGSIVVYVSLNKSGAEGYKNCFISEWAFSVLPLLLSFLMPESPTYFVRKGFLKTARRHQRRLTSSDKETDVILEQLCLSIELENCDRAGTSSGYLDCFKGVNRRRTLIVMFANLVPQIFGITLLAKASYFMQVIGMDAHTSLVFLQVGISLGILANVGSIFTLAKFGRVPLTLFGFAVSTLLWTGMGIAGCYSGTVTIWYTQITLMLVIILCGLSTWPASYAFGAEASSLQLRAKAQGIGWLVNCFTNGALGLVLPYIFNPDEGALGAKTGFIYTGFCILGLIATWALVPEMKNRMPMEIDRMFESGLKAREFIRWSEDDGVSDRGGAEGEAKGEGLPSHSVFVW